MSRPIRFQPEPWCVFFVTARCIQSRFLLRPSPRTNALIIGVLARALKRFDVKLFGLCFMSNHYHLLLSSRDAAHLASFMQYIGSNIARELGRQHDWREKFWSRRYHSSIVLDEAAQEDRLRYILSNSVKEGLVKHPRYWPGVHCFRHLAEGTPLHGTWIDRSAKYRSRHLGEKSFTTDYSLELARLPCHEALSEHEHQKAVRALTREALDQCDTPDSYIGQIRILAMDPHAKPKQTDKSPAPLCHAGCMEAKKAFKAAFLAFVQAYKEAYQRLFRQQLPAHFPEGGLAPTGWSIPPLPG